MANTPNASTIAGITASCQNIQKATVTILGHFEVGDQEVAA
jgi:hypothetical protein